MVVRILWSFVAIVTIYVIAIFFFPAKADEIGEVLGIKQMNLVLRELRDGGMQDVEIVIDGGTSGYLGGLQEKVDSAKGAVEQTKATIETKVEQTKKVVDSVQKAAGAIQEVKNNVGELTTLSGSSGTGSGTSAS